MAVSFEEWCKHYDYDPESREAAEDWERYQSEKALFASMIDDQDQQTEPGR